MIVYYIFFYFVFDLIKIRHSSEINSYEIFVSPNHKMNSSLTFLNIDSAWNFITNTFYQKKEENLIFHIYFEQFVIHNFYNLSIYSLGDDKTKNCSIIFDTLLNDNNLKNSLIKLYANSSIEMGNFNFIIQNLNLSFTDDIKSTISKDFMFIILSNSNFKIVKSSISFILSSKMISTVILLSDSFLIVNNSIIYETNLINKTIFTFYANNLTKILSLSQFSFLNSFLKLSIVFNLFGKEFKLDCHEISLINNNFTYNSNFFLMQNSFDNSMKYKIGINDTSLIKINFLFGSSFVKIKTFSFNSIDFCIFYCYYKNFKISQSNFQYSNFIFSSSDCSLINHYRNISIFDNNFIGSIVFRIPQITLNSSQIFNNSFEKNSFLINNNYDDYNYGNLTNNMDIIDTHIYRNNVTGKSLIKIQKLNSLNINNCNFFNNIFEKSIMILMIDINLVSFQSNLFRDQTNKYQLSFLLCLKLAMVENSFYNEKIIVNPLNENSDFFEYGGCISISLFTNLVIKELLIMNLTSYNTNLFQIIRDDSYEKEPSIIQLEINNTFLIKNNFSSDIYPISIYNILIAQSPQNILIFSKNIFNENRLISKTPNQINNAICFLLIAIQSQVLFTNIIVNFTAVTVYNYQTSLLYLNTFSIIIDSSLFWKINSDQNSDSHKNLNHVKLFGNFINITNCEFFNLGGENGGALFLSSIGNDSATTIIRINNSFFFQNSGTNGGAIYLNEPSYIDETIIENCSFFNNKASKGTLIYAADYENINSKKNIINDNDDNIIFISIINCYSEENEDDYLLYQSSIDIHYEGNIAIKFQNITFNKSLYGINIFGGVNNNQSLLLKSVNFLNFNTLFNYDYLFNARYHCLDFKNLNYIIIHNCNFSNISLYSGISYSLKATSLIHFSQEFEKSTQFIKFKNNSFSNIFFDFFGDYDQNIFFSNFGIIFFDVDTKNILIVKCNFSNISINYELLGDISKNTKINVTDSVIVLLNSTLTIRKSIFYNISFFQGSCITTDSLSFLIINNVIFLSNKAKYFASSLWIKNSDLNLENSIFLDNYSPFYELINIEGNGNILIRNNEFNITIHEKMNSSINFNLGKTFIYNCSLSKIDDSDILVQNIKCNRFSSTEFISQEIIIKINDTQDLLYLNSDYDEFLLNNDDNTNQTYLPQELINLTIYNYNLTIKDNITTNTSSIINFYNNKFYLSNISYIDQDENILFLLNFFDKENGIRYTNIKTHKSMLDPSIAFSYILSINLNQCPLGYIYIDESKSCIKCSTGTYSLDPLQNECKLCSSFGNCVDGVLQPKAHYWRSSIVSDNLFFCRSDPDNCVGKLQSLCLEGSIGPKCQSCDYKNDFVKKFNHKCEKCGLDLLSDTIIGIFFYIFQIGVLLYYIYSWISTIDLIKKEQNRLNEDDIVRFKKRLHIYMDIFGNYFQIIALISLLKTEKLPNFVYQILVIAFPPSLIDSKYCLFLEISKKNIIYVNLVYIILIPFWKFLIILLFLFILKKKKKELEINKNSIILGLICLYKFEVLGQALELFSYLSCENIEGILYVTKDLQFICGRTDPSSTYFVYYLTIMIPFAFLWIIIIPFYLIYKMFIEYKNNSLQNNYNLEKYGALFIGYDKDYFYWEIARILHKVIFVAISKFVLFDPARIILIIGIFCFYAITLNICRPYIYNHFNRVEIVASIIYIAFFLIFIYNEYSLLYASIDNSYDYNNKIVKFFDGLFYWINIFLNAGFICYLLFKSLFEMKRKATKYIKRAKDFIEKLRMKSINNPIGTEDDKEIESNLNSDFQENSNLDKKNNLI